MKRRDLIIAGGIAIGAPFVLAATRSEERQFAHVIAEMNHHSFINTFSHEYRKEVSGRDLPKWTSMQNPRWSYYPPEVELTLTVLPPAEVTPASLAEAAVAREKYLVERVKKHLEDISDGRHIFVYATTRFGGWRVIDTDKLTFGRVVSVVATLGNCVFTPEENSEYFTGKWVRM